MAVGTPDLASGSHEARFHTSQPLFATLASSQCPPGFYDRAKKVNELPDYASLSNTEMVSADELVRRSKVAAEVPPFLLPFIALE